METMDSPGFDKLLGELDQRLNPGASLVGGVPADIVNGLGTLVVEFQQLEHFVGVLTAQLAGITAKAGLHEALLSNLSFSRLLDTLAAVAKVTNYDRQDELAILIRMAGQAEDARNRMLHSLWHDGGRLKVKAGRKAGVTYSGQKHDDVKLQELARRISQVAFCFAALTYLDLNPTRG